MACMPDVSIVSHFKDPVSSTGQALPDPRIERAKKHRLIDIIVIALGLHHGRWRRIPGHGTIWQKQTGVAGTISRPAQRHSLA